MSDALTIAANGLDFSASRIAKAASNIVNATSSGFGSDLAANLVGIAEDKNNYLADAKAVRVARETSKSLLDILA